jgi:cytochrome c-type biogenesis protein CcmH/NrfG
LTLSCSTAWSQSAVSKAADSALIARAAAHRCHSPHATVDDCDDAVRWNPQDPSILIAMGDVQMRAQHPADADRAYRHALALAPNTPGIQQKITNAEARLAKSNARAKAKVNAKTDADAKAAPAALSASAPKAPPQSAATAPAAVKHFSNADPETQSH